MVLQALRRPIPTGPLIVGTAAAAAAVALYCLTYTWLAGRPESAAAALGWATANVLPWLLAIEAGKRAKNASAAGARVVAALGASIALGYLLGVSTDGAAFELTRRLPAFAASASLVALIRSSVGHASETAEIPLSPRQIDWVQAAGNYIELRSGNRIVVHRLPIGAAERCLAPHGFVRIHRSTLVRRDRIARVRPQDVVLFDGTHLKIGKRYRAELDS